MIRYLFLVFYVAMVCACASQTETNPSLSNSHPIELIGTWKLIGDENDGLWFTKYYSNGKNVVVGIYYDTIIAYEAEWWVKNNVLYERVIDSLYNDFFKSEIGKIYKDTIIDMTFKKHTIKDESNDEIDTYLKTFGDSFIDKYHKIDNDLLKLQATLPEKDVGGISLLSAFRDEDTITYIYRRTTISKNEFDIDDHKSHTIKIIQLDPELMNYMMNFKFINILSDEEIVVLNITPSDYMVKEK